MTITKDPPGGSPGGSGNTSFPGGNDTSSIALRTAPKQAEILRLPHWGVAEAPAAISEARLCLIREELYGGLDEIRIFAERGLRAIEVENDLDLGRAFEQSVKHFLAVAENLKELIAVKMDAPP
jgi:hypothetical protein